MTLVNHETGEVAGDATPSTIRIVDVKVGERARRDYGDLDGLIASIREHGLLQPIALIGDDELLYGGRRLEACRQLGEQTIPYIRTRTRDDAISRLKAERDENTCRKDMTPEELVDLGLQLQELEAPKAKERMTSTLRQGDQSPLRPNERSGRAETDDVVSDAIGLSRNTYKRARNVVQTARGEKEDDPSIQQTAQTALADMNSGKASISGAYTRTRKARKPDTNPDKSEQEKPKPTTRPGPRRYHAQILSTIVHEQLAGIGTAIEPIDQLDHTVTSEEAAHLTGDLSKAIRELKRINTLLKERTK